MLNIAPKFENKIETNIDFRILPYTLTSAPYFFGNREGVNSLLVCICIRSN